MRKKPLLVIGLLVVIVSIVPATKAQAQHWIHVPYSAILWQRHAPNNAWNANDLHCNDNYSQWNAVPQNQIMPTNNLGTHALNPVTDAAAIWHWGFSGWFDCTQGLCWVRLCNTDVWDSDPWSVRLGSW